MIRLGKDAGPALATIAAAPFVADAYAATGDLAVVGWWALMALSAIALLALADAPAGEARR